MRNMTSRVPQRLGAIAALARHPLNPVAKAAQDRLAKLILASANPKVDSPAVKKRRGETRAKPKQSEEYGLHIWIYKHVRTQQVVYSLTQKLEVCMPQEQSSATY